MLSLSVIPFLTLSFPLVSLALSHEPRGQDTKVSAAFYTSWHADDVPLSSVNWEGFNTVIYAAIETTPDVHQLKFDGSNESLLPQFVKEAHSHGVSAQVLIGGWGGSLYFSSNMRSAANRTAFVETVVNFLDKYDLDGVNFDWEYPGFQGVGCNTIDTNDSANFLAFLQEFYKAISGKNITVSASVPITPWRGADGKPLTNVLEFAKVLDWVNIMNYDIYGSWSDFAGPNSPVDDSCADAKYQFGSAVSAVKAWRAAGFPLKKMVLGVPSYGHSFRVPSSDAFKNGTKELSAYPPFNKTMSIMGGPWDNATTVDVCGVKQAPGGTWNFRGLVEKGWLDQNGKPAKGIYSRYDSCSRTPYLYNESLQVMISYDNAQSFAAKGKFIKGAKLAGFALWESGGDYHKILVGALESAL